MQVAAVDLGDGDALEIELALSRLGSLLLFCRFGTLLDIVAPQVATRAFGLVFGVLKLQILLLLAVSRHLGLT